MNKRTKGIVLGVSCIVLVVSTLNLINLRKNNNYDNAEVSNLILGTDISITELKQFMINYIFRY